MNEKELMIDKYATKQFLLSYGFKVPTTYYMGNKLDSDLIDHFPDEFVIKHLDGSSGDHVLILKRKNDHYVDPVGKKITRDDLIGYEHKWKSRMFLVEERIHSHSYLMELCELNNVIVDIRSYVKDRRYQMSRMRIPNMKSKGLANTCRGAKVVNIKNGRLFDSKVFTTDILPELTENVIIIPNFRKMELECNKICGLFKTDFFGIDGTIDRDGDFVVIELEFEPRLHFKEGINRIPDRF